MTVRTIVMGIVMAFALGFVGCRSCLAPYETCQPTFIPERGDQCMGELYRCGSTLGGAEQTTSANGDCEECVGGGSVEYYSANGYDAAAELASANNESPYLQASYQTSQSVPAGPYAEPIGAFPDFSASSGNYDFNLRDDSTDY